MKSTSWVNRTVNRNVKDPALRQRIREVAWNQDKVTDASRLLVLCADLNAWAKEPER